MKKLFYLLFTFTSLVYAQTPITDANFDGNNVIYTIENTTITANQSFEDVSLFVDGNGISTNVYLASNGVTI